mmetsp:Transcript_22070/g.57580  ORF Transcript_22070/g.57580 Transcript_22070/m.57580 type:complete len:215 (+) Transcript_22070:515-1159(+)
MDGFAEGAGFAAGGGLAATLDFASVDVLFALLSAEGDRTVGRGRGRAAGTSPDWPGGIRAAGRGLAARGCGCGAGDVADGCGSSVDDSPEAAPNRATESALFALKLARLGKRFPPAFGFARIVVRCFRVGAVDASASNSAILTGVLSVPLALLSSSPAAASFASGVTDAADVECTFCVGSSRTVSSASTPVSPVLACAAAARFSALPRRSRTDA